MLTCTIGLLARRHRGAALHAIGDGVAPRGIHPALLAGTRVARAI